MLKIVDEFNSQARLISNVKKAKRVKQYPMYQVNRTCGQTVGQVVETHLTWLFSSQVQFSQRSLDHVSPTLTIVSN
jgi:hypothetical protein